MIKNIHLIPKALVTCMLLMLFAKTNISAQLSGADTCEEIKFCYGIIADCQYCACSPGGNSYFGNSIPKLQEAVDTFNSRGVTHTLHLGDFIQQDFSSYDAVEPVYSSLDSAHYYALGNHEFSVSEAEKTQILTRLGMQDYYYSFSRHNWRFIVLESTELAFYSEAVHPDKVAERDALWQQIAGAVNAKGYNGGISQEQLNWLDQTISEAAGMGQQVLVFAHHPIWPLTSSTLWNYQEVIDVLESHANVVAYMNGHRHVGDYAVKNGIHYITFQGMLLTPDENSFSLIEVFRDELLVKGFGRQPDYVLPFAPQNQAPEAILLDNNEIEEGLPASTFIGQLSANDVDVDDYNEVSLVSGNGDTNNALFYIENNQLFTNTPLDVTQSPLSIRLRTTDCAGDFFEQTFEIFVQAVCATIDIHVLMEGPYDSANSAMKTTLNTVRGILPGQSPIAPLSLPTAAGQPYADLPWTYPGTEGSDFTSSSYMPTVVDWVLLSFRSSTSPGTEVAKTAALLHNDGHIDLVETCLRLMEGEDYYVVIEHRNHLPVMSHVLVEVIDGILTYDFSAQDAYKTASTSGAKELTPGVWAMYAGNVYPDYISIGYEINGADKANWLYNNGNFNAYLLADVNLDGDINGGDKSMWFENNGIFSAVPR